MNAHRETVMDILTAGDEWTENSALLATCIYLNQPDLFELNTSKGLMMPSL